MSSTGVIIVAIARVDTAVFAHAGGRIGTCTVLACVGRAGVTVRALSVRRTARGVGRALTVAVVTCVDRAVVAVVALVI